MVKVSTKRRAAPQNQQESDVLTALAQGAPQGQDPAPSRESPAGGHSKAGNGKEGLSATEQLLMQQIEALNQRNQEIASQLESVSRAAMAGPPRQEQPIDLGPAPGEVNLQGLPSPITEPERYGQELAKRVQAHTNAVASYNQRRADAERSSAQSHEQQINALWEDFSLQHPELAEYEDRVGFVAQKVVQAAQRRGIEPGRYMFQHQDIFFRDIIREYEKVFGATEEEEEGPEPQGAPADRTAGIFGGGPSGARPGPKGPPAGDMIDDIRAIQRKSGFF